MGSLVVSLGDPRCREADLVGNKAAVLAKLLALGYRVPAGACVTTAAPGRDRAEWEAELRAEVGDLEPPWVARSSSTAEDAAEQAFPGLFRTVLGVPDFSSLLGAVRLVQESVASDTARAYASRLELDMATVRMAVLVQRLLPATVSGVAYSRDPVSAEDVILIEANYGLGKSVVEGLIVPDRVEVFPDGSTSAVQVGTKRLKVVPAADGVKEVTTSAVERRTNVLTPPLIRNVARVVRRIEEDLGTPQDVEWLTVRHALFVLQARPLTALPRGPEAA